MATDQPHWANWLLGGGLLAAFVGLAIEPIYFAAALDGRPTPDMRGFYSFGATEGVLIGLSAACLVGGVVILAVQPIRETVSVEVGAGTLRLRGTF